MAPPADSSSEDEYQGDIPARDESTKKLDKNDDASDSDDDMDDDNEDEEEYIVEQILGHEFRDGELFYVVKWKGYDDPNDHTLEPEENLENAKEAVDEYIKKLGGPPQDPKDEKKKNKKRKSRASSAATSLKQDDSEAEAAATTSTTKKKARQSTGRASTGATPGAAAAAENKLPDWVPKTKSWEDAVESIDTIMRDPEDPKGPLFVYLNWTNGHKSRVSTEMANKRCPQKMLHFYEQHIVFKDTE
ncbi:chromo domain-containing protein [Ascosphaera apis ARSEF 7405]|uniref:Chromo domain-containing protein n=1 Tax=Ascosphaera apis ARSEF 7405 TaxID=392613 RepID=A0A167X3E7_9EURO|nr:chromo domain-containing protein [Ascosphaera apis ARSEF 7405]